MRAVYPAPRHLQDPEDFEYFKSCLERGHFDLSDTEKEWRDRSEFLEARGYQLRPRFRKGWKPSWFGTDLNPYDCEDSYVVIVSLIQTATNILSSCISELSGHRRH